jgi:hypothetical protein
VGVVNCESPKVLAFSENDVGALEDIARALAEILPAKGWYRSVTRDTLPYLSWNAPASHETLYTPEPKPRRRPRRKKVKRRK